MQAMPISRSRCVRMSTSAQPRPALVARAEVAEQWHHVRANEVREAIAGTGLDAVVRHLESATMPPMPLQVTLPQAMVLVGAALSQPRESYRPDDLSQKQRGIELANLRINTAHGQACNVWALVVAPSGVGKDIGRADALAAAMDLHLATSGSAEGLADAYMENGAGILFISEFSPWLDPKRWQYAATPWLTDAFNRGFFKVALSRRRGAAREARYCYPGVLANIQPEALADCADRRSIDSGFLPRFLVSLVEEEPTWRPTTKGIERSHALDALSAYKAISGEVNVPEGYLGFLFDEFSRQHAPLGSHWRRLVNEYGPRIAVMLSGSALVNEDHWRRTAVVLRWFYGMAERALLSLGEDPYARRTNATLASMAEFVRVRSPCPKTTFSHRFSRQVPLGADRDRLLDELVERGQIRRETRGKAESLVWTGDGGDL